MPEPGATARTCHATGCTREAAHRAQLIAWTAGTLGECVLRCPTDVYACDDHQQARAADAAFDPVWALIIEALTGFGRDIRTSRDDAVVEFAS